MVDSAELLQGLSIQELEALADCQLAPSAQDRLNDLLAGRKENSLPASDEAELNQLLQRTDQLTLLKTRARYTLSRTKAALAGA